MGDELQTAAALVVQFGDPFAGRVGERIGDLHQEDAVDGAGADQADADGAGGVPQGVGHQFTDQ
jgi:hypothetical protein